MLENVKPLLQWFDALERRIKFLEAEVKELRDDALIRDFQQSVADLTRGDGKAPVPLRASKPPRTVGLSNIPQVRRRGRPARA